jgi:hypothetical protein
MKTTRTSHDATRPARRLTYANIMSTVAVVLLLVGGGAAVAGVAKNSVTSKSIKNNAVTSIDLKDGAAVASADLVDNSLTGTDIDESTFSTTPKGPAGGDLTGSYPNPSLGPNSVSSGEVADGSLGEADLGAGSVTSSELGTITLRSGTTSVPAGQWGDLIIGCNAGEIALSGGGQSGSSLMPLIRSRRGLAAESWVVQAFNGAAEARPLEAYVSCLAP